MSADRYELYAGKVQMAAKIWSLVEGMVVAKAADRQRPGVEHTVTINGVDYLRYRLRADGLMEMWLR